MKWILCLNFEGGRPDDVSLTMSKLVKELCRHTDGLTLTGIDIEGPEVADVVAEEDTCG